MMAPPVRPHIAQFQGESLFVGRCPSGGRAASRTCPTPTSGASPHSGCWSLSRPCRTTTSPSPPGCATPKLKCRQQQRVCMTRGLYEGACTAVPGRAHDGRGLSVADRALDKAVQKRICSGAAQPVRLCRNSFDDDSSGGGGSGQAVSAPTWRASRHRPAPARFISVLHCKGYHWPASRRWCTASQHLRRLRTSPRPHRPGELHAWLSQQPELHDLVIVYIRRVAVSATCAPGVEETGWRQLDLAGTHTAASCHVS